MQAWRFQAVKWRSILAAKGDKPDRLMIDATHLKDCRRAVSLGEPPRSAG
jgi:hypothetical protein